MDLATQAKGAASVSSFFTALPNIDDVYLLRAKFAAGRRYSCNYDMVLTLRLGLVLVRETESKKTSTSCAPCSES